MNALAIELQTYFTAFAHAQRDLAANTISAYRDTWRMLIKYLAETTRTRAEHIDFTDVDAEHVSAFLDYLETERDNTVSTRNCRLCAIRAVLSHAVANHPEHAATITRVLAMPPKRHPQPMLEFLTTAEADALINAPDRKRWTGRRDHALLVLAIQTGLRVSELCSLTTSNAHLGSSANITCAGKGRRKRATPLTASTVAVMTAYLTERAARPGQALFCGPTGHHLSRDALEHRLAIHLATAAPSCPSLAEKHVTLHTLRHTAAMNLLAQGVDVAVIALWLGHQRTQSADAYLHADMNIKQTAIDRTRPPNTKPGTYHPEPNILAWLGTL
jgi:site-specific recombinase XerD